jgi:electron transport complex protein RnfG
MSATPPAAAPVAPEWSSARLVTTVGLAGLLSGLAIVGTYEATLPRIQENQRRALEAAVFEVVPGSEALQGLVVRDGRLVPATSAPGEGDGDEAEVFGAYDADGRFVGYAIAAEGPGFQDTIRLLFGFDPDRARVVGLQVLESRETPGLGDKIVKDDAFLDGFRDLAVSPRVVVVPNGTSSAPNEVDGITGATISSKAVVKIVNGAAERWVDRLPGADAAPAPPSAAGGSGGTSVSGEES